MNFSTVLNVGRALLLLTTLCAVGTWILWTRFPERIGRMDYQWRLEYVKEHEDRYSMAVEAIEGGDRDGGIDMLEEMAAELEPIQKRDRLDKVKRSTLARLMTEYASKGDVERAAEFADVLHAFDDRDLEHAVKRALLLERVPGREGETEQILSGLLGRIPTLHAASTAYSTYLLSNDRGGEAVDVVLRAVDNGMTEIQLDGWSGYWDATGKGFAGARRQNLQLQAAREGNEYWTSMKIPAKEPGLNRFRIDLPPGVTFRLSKWKLGFVAGEIVEVLDGLENHEKIKQMREVDGALIVEGGRDAWVSYKVPDSLHQAKGINVRFHATIDPLLPRAMRELALDEERLPRVRDWFEDRGRSADYERFLDMARN